MSQEMFKHQLEKSMKNMCVLCTKNDVCMLPLHGKLSPVTGECPEAELVSEQEVMMWALKDVYCLTDAQCTRFFKKARKNGYL